MLPQTSGKEDGAFGKHRQALRKHPRDSGKLPRVPSPDREKIAGLILKSFRERDAAKNDTQTTSVDTKRKQSYEAATGTVIKFAGCRFLSE
jgi:hypothetical protein